MTLTKDIFLRAHVVELQAKEKATNNYAEPKWAEYALCCDAETSLDPQEQALIFGWYRVLRLVNGIYQCVEEGIFHADDLDKAQIAIIKSYVRSHRSEVANSDYDENIKVYTRSEWIEKVFFAAVKLRALIVAFNAGFDISRVAVDYRASRDRAWSFVLSQREFDVEKLRKNWLSKKWEETKNGNLRTRCGDYSVTITHQGVEYRADVYTPDRERLSGKWNSSIDAAKEEGLRILSEHVDAIKRTGQPVLELNPERPRVTVTAKDSKAAFFSLRKPLHPEEWPTYKVTRTGKESFRMIFRVLDLRTLGWALFNVPYTLGSLCEALQTKNRKLDHDPTGITSKEELDYGRQDLRCSVDVLNKLKQEFDRHPIDLHPDKAVSPASIGKAYLRAMNIIPPKEKFADVPDYIQGIAAQAFSAGRAEIRIRHTAVPVCHCDLTSQYPTVNSLLGNPEVLAAERLSFDDVTDEIRALVENITLEDCFNRELWRNFKVFVRVKPDKDLLPVRAEYTNDGVTKNIGMEFFTSEKPVWYTLCDVIASKLLNNNKVPCIEKAYRMMPHGQQPGLRPVKLRDEIEVDPRKDDLFAVMIEQKELLKKSAKQKKLRGDIPGAESDKALSYFLKICANATSYGMWAEMTPQKLFNPIEVKVFSGEHSEELTVSSVERPGPFYFFPIAALITGGAHLMLALIQRCIEDKGGHHIFCDTDSMCFIASEKGGWVRCPGERGPNGEYGIKALSWKEVDEIVKWMGSLNPYDRKKVPGSILKVEDVNSHDGKQIELHALAISAKRYVMWRYDTRGNIVIVDAKAHALGVLYPPKENKTEESEDWIYEAWHEILEGTVATPRPTPDWYNLPAMMRIAVTTPAVLGMLKGIARPNNFVFMPMAFPTYNRKGTKREANFSLIMPFSKHREEWASTKAIDTRTGKNYRIHPGVDPYGRRKPGEIWVKTYGNFLGEYRAHPEAKFVDREGNPCTDTTQGLLRPSHIVARDHRYIGKETSRHWEQGDDMSLVDFRCMEYRSDGKVVANKETRERVGKFSERRIEKGTGLDRKTIRLIRRGIESVKPVTLSKIIKFLDEQKPKTKPFSEDTLADLPDLKELRETLDPKKQKKLIALYDKRVKILESLM